MIRGNVPKEDSVFRRTHKDPIETVDLTESTRRLGPDLPSWRKWLLPTVQWWDTWRTSPQAVHFQETDWHELAAAALLLDEFWNPATTISVRLRISAELRARTSHFGATYEDRAKLRMRMPKTLAEETKSTGGKVVSIDYRQRLSAS